MPVYDTHTHMNVTPVTGILVDESGGGAGLENIQRETKRKAPIIQMCACKLMIGQSVGGEAPTCD